MNKIFLVALGALILGAGFFSYFWYMGNANAGWEEYSNDIIGLSFNYPSGWQVNEREAGKDPQVFRDVFAKPEDAPEGVGVGAEQLLATVSSPDGKQMIAIGGSAFGSVLPGAGTKKINGVQAYIAHAQGDAPATILHWQNPDEVWLFVSVNAEATIQERVLKSVSLRN